MNGVFIIQAAGQVVKHYAKFVYLGKTVRENVDLKRLFEYTTSLFSSRPVSAAAVHRNNTRAQWAETSIFWCHCCAYRPLFSLLPTPKRSVIKAHIHTPPRCFALATVAEPAWRHWKRGGPVKEAHRTYPAVGRTFDLVEKRVTKSQPRSMKLRPR